MTFNRGTDTIERWFNRWCAEEVKKIKAEKPNTIWAEYKRTERLDNAASAVKSNSVAPIYQMPDDDRQYTTVEVQQPVPQTYPAEPCRGDEYKSSLTGIPAYLSMMSTNTPAQKKQVL
jgi:hypothetical protein